ncbi:DUF421 domain-containing protein [Rhodopirellula sp. JC740]|uniref:DUF421 domain-containing protein n=1 Tax=Rhodopirellula halodulae TaxID=2894198 RepID=A0ABS8NI17_9BACT|nr:YetF domain-containing protein [Rhodopirellula sp. JC740]MCC9643193.1 DUF421 domain-containing protein [Rhodopirellula sp. JC740]
MKESIDTWFNSIDRLESVAIGSIYFYLLVILVVRISGKRLTSQMNNFDWIVTIAIGSLVGSGILLKDVSITDATTAIAILASLQWLTTYLVMKSSLFRRVVKPQPSLLTHKGQFVTENMQRERISESEVFAKLREKGFTSLAEANWVVLETDGSLTVIPKRPLTFREAKLLQNVAAPSWIE